MVKLKRIFKLTTFFYVVNNSVKLFLSYISVVILFVFIEMMYVIHYKEAVSCVTFTVFCVSFISVTLTIGEGKEFIKDII